MLTTSNLFDILQIGLYGYEDSFSFLRVCQLLVVVQAHSPNDISLRFAQECAVIGCPNSLKWLGAFYNQLIRAQ